MRKSTIFPVIALSALTLGTISTALPAGAALQHSVKAGEDGDTTTPTVPNNTGSGGGGGGGGSSTPSGGASTGGGGMASTATSNPNVALWLTTGGVGLALVGTGLVARRRRDLHPALAETSSSASTTEP
jgi:hypothetical protein